MPIYDDTAIFKTPYGFARPSDLVGLSRTKLLTVAGTQLEKYMSFKVRKTVAPYAHIRYSSGTILNLGYDNVMIGTIHTGYEGCEPKTTFDVVRDIRQNFKYRVFIPKDYVQPEGSKCIIELEDFTDKKKGVLDITDENVCKFFGWAIVSGACFTKYFKITTINETREFWEDVCSKLPVQIINIKQNEGRTFFYFQNNWFIDVVIEMCGIRDGHALADDFLFECTESMARNMYTGIVSCKKTDPLLMYKDAPRHTLYVDECNIADICYLFHKAGVPTLLSVNTVKRKFCRICEQIPRWSQYVQKVEHVDVPKQMYKVEPIENKGVNALWVSEILFKSY